MPVGEVIFGFIGEMIVFFIFEIVIEGIGRLFRSIYYGLRKLITGKEREIPEIKRLERRLLYKKIILRSDLNEQIPKGTRGTVMEIIDERTLYVEFENDQGNPIEIDGETIFSVERRKIMQERRKRTSYKR